MPTEGDVSRRVLDMPQFRARASGSVSEAGSPRRSVSRGRRDDASDAGSVASGLRLSRAEREERFNSFLARQEAARQRKERNVRRVPTCVAAWEELH